MVESKPCVFCGLQLYPVAPQGDWKNMQPDGGGEVRFIFGFGSRKFDLELHGTEFVGLICDECAEKCIGAMERRENKVELGQ